MARLDLTQEDADMLREILSGDLADLRYEIANTDSYDFREALRRKQGLLERVIAQLGS